MRDLLVIGGGINGVGIARDAAGRGLSVTLVEQHDLAAHTSSASSKLIHGGLRYLEQYEFRLVREALREREVLLRAAPHIVRPLRFILPHDRHLRPRWMLRAGLFLYDRLGGGRSLPASAAVPLAGGPLAPRFTHGFAYWDCWVEDARLVVLSARDAAERAADICPRTRCVALTRHADRWVARLVGPEGESEIAARALVNAAGPWVDELARMALGPATPRRVRLVKGSHLVVPRLYDGDHAYILQQRDGRVVFALPFEGRFTLIGTTDTAFDGDPATVAIDAAERAYLLAAASDAFGRQVDESEVHATYSGVRPLYDDGAARNSTVTRDYAFALDSTGGAPLLSVYGGKITTYRKLAEHALARLAPHIPAMGPAWTAGAVLPGGDLPAGGADALAATLSERHPALVGGVAQRWARSYGTRALDILAPGAAPGPEIAPGLFAGELEYLAAQEWAAGADDVLDRRTRLGLHYSAGERAAVARWFARRLETAGAAVQGALDPPR